MAVTLETIKKAKETIEHSIKRTPLIECPTLEKELGGKVLFKLENLQKTLLQSLECQSVPCDGIFVNG